MRALPGCLSMKKDVILAKIESLSRCIRRIESKRPSSAETLAKDLDLQDIIVVNLERAVQVSVDIASMMIAKAGLKAPGSMGEAFEWLAEAAIIPNDLAGHLQKAVGFRNIAVHEYRQISWDRVFALISARLDDFRDFSRQAMKHFGL